MIFSRRGFLIASTARRAAAWRAAWRRDQLLGLYGADGFHPSPIGTYLAALVFFERLTGRSVLGLPDPSASRERALADVHLTPAQLAALQEAAAEAGRRSAGGGDGRSPRVQ